MLYPNLIILNSIFEEYKEERVNQAETSFWEITKNAISSTISKQNSINNLRKICNKFSKDFVIANKASVEEKTELFLDTAVRIGDTAFEVEEIHSSSGPSHFAEKLHLARTLILRASALKQAKEKRIALYEKELKDINTQIETQTNLRNLENKLPERQTIQTSIDNLAIKRDRYLRQLAYLGKVDYITALNATERNKLFPKLEYPKEETNSLSALTHIKKFNLNFALPLELHPNYDEIFIQEHYKKSIQEFMLDGVEHHCDKYGLDDEMKQKLKSQVIIEVREDKLATPNTLTQPMPSPLTLNTTESSITILKLIQDSNVENPPAPIPEIKSENPTEIAVPNTFHPNTALVVNQRNKKKKNSIKQESSEYDAYQTKSFGK